MSNVQLYHGDCLEVMKTLPDECIDLIVTSPPYWNQRDYSYWPHYEYYMNDVALWVNECARLLRPGRHCFWVIPDKFPWPPRENGTRERLYLPVYADTERCADKAGLVCEFPIIWKKSHGTRKMFGSYPYPPTTIHTPMTERICVWRKPGKADLAHKGPESKYTKEEWVNWGQDLWKINPETRLKKNHPAPFPVEIPQRIIRLWSFVGDIVLDPFCGSGTVGVACKKLSRKFIGIDISKDYLEINLNRINTTQEQTT